MRTWNSPPDRRELTLLLFCLVTFLVSYNLNLTFLSPRTAILNHFKFTPSASTPIGPDGRHLPSWRDDLEKMIVGDWKWDHGHIAGDGAERSSPRGKDTIYFAQWTDGKDTEVAGDIFGEGSANDVVEKWDASPAETTLVQHVPGYTILDRVILANHSLYIVTDKPETFPPLAAMFGDNQLLVEMLSPDRALEVLGNYAGKIQGVTFVSNDIVPHNSTLFSLWRAYTALDPRISTTAETTLAFPRRLFFPHIPTFSDIRPLDEGWIRGQVRPRSDAGLHPFTAKLAFPTLQVMYAEDWYDFHLMQVPWVFERMLVADRSAASRSDIRGSEARSIYNLPASPHWWEPVRQSLASFFDDGTKNSKPVITYLSVQNTPDVVKLSVEDDEKLIKALNQMGRRQGFDVRIVPGDATWDIRMSAVVASTVILSVHGSHLADSVYIQPSVKATVMEFFPKGHFIADNQITTKALGYNYVAWWGEKHMSGDSLPKPNKISPSRKLVPNPENPTHLRTTAVDPPAVVDLIVKILG